MWNNCFQTLHNKQCWHMILRVGKQLSDPQNHFGFLSGGIFWIIKLGRVFPSRAQKVCEFEETKIRILENKVTGSCDSQHRTSYKRTGWRGRSRKRETGRGSRGGERRRKRHRGRWRLRRSCLEICISSFDYKLNTTLWMYRYVGNCPGRGQRDLGMVELFYISV